MKMAEMFRELIKDHGNMMKSFHGNKRRPPEGGAFNWLLTYAARDCMEFCIALVTGLIEGMCARVCRAFQAFECAQRGAGRLLRRLLSARNAAQICQL